jgi:hypothetical protein
MVVEVEGETGGARRWRLLLIRRQINGAGGGGAQGQN